MAWEMWENHGFNRDIDFCGGKNHKVLEGQGISIDDIHGMSLQMIYFILRGFKYWNMAICRSSWGLNYLEDDQYFELFLSMVLGGSSQESCWWVNQPW